MTGWCSGYSAEVVASAMFCQLVREFESHPVHFLILFQNFEKLSSKIGVSSNLVCAQKTSYPTISAPSATMANLIYKTLVAVSYLTRKSFSAHCQIATGNSLTSTFHKN